MKKIFINCLLIFFGSFFYAVGIGFFLSPHRLAAGGVSGLSIILGNIFNISTGTVVLLLNIPLILLGIKKFGIKFFLSTVAAIIISSTFINIAELFPPITYDLILSAIFGGAFVSLGIGLVFRGGATTGGSDILVKLLKNKYRHLKTGTIFLITDCFIIFFSAIVFKDVDSALYASLAVIVQAFVLDIVLYGTDGARLIYIVSSKSGEIAEKILFELSVGATYIEGTGAFSNKRKAIILCAVRKQILPIAKEIVYSIDPKAFMIVTGANEIFGEGFKEYDSPEL